MADVTRAAVKDALRSIFPGVPDDELERFPCWVEAACGKLFRLDESHTARAELIRAAAKQLDAGHIKD